MGKRIWHCGYFPSWNLRLFKRGAARYEDRPVHEHMILNGRDGYLKGMLAHEDRRGLEYYIAKHNRYSTLRSGDDLFREARRHVRNEARRIWECRPASALFKTHVYPKLPAKWFWRFVWMYFIERGFLDGIAGLRFCLLISSHELFTSLKLAELQRQAKLRLADAVSPQGDTTSDQLVDQPTAETRVARSPSVGEIAPQPKHLPSKQLSVRDQELDEQRRRSPWTLKEKIMRVTWMVIRTLLFRPSFHNWYGWRNLILRIFGARIAPGVRIRPTVWVEIPWNLDIREGAAVGDHAILYSLGRITIGRQAVVSQYAHLCAGTHDYRYRSFPLLRPPIVIGDDAWIAADVFVGPGVTVGDRSVVGARATIVKDVPPDVVMGGNPAKVIKAREFLDA